MAWSIEEQVLRGEIDNRRPGRVIGKIWLAGRDEAVELELEGNPWRDLAGHLLKFTNPDAKAAEGPRLSAYQQGMVGDMTASRKVSDGYNRMWDLGGGVAVNRASLPAPLDPWPNVIVARRTTSGPLTGGETLPLELKYQSETTGVGDPSLSLLLDPDSNPWNGNEILLSTETLTGSGFSSVLTVTPAPLLPAQTDGRFFLLTRISEDGRTRYLNLREPLVITASQPPPSIVPGSLRFEAGLFTLTINGSTGQLVTVQAATNLDDWQTIDTVTLASPVQNFSDPDSASFPRRFYRIAAAPPP